MIIHIKSEGANRGDTMDLIHLTQFFILCIVLCTGLTAVSAAAATINIMENWDEHRCDPYIVPVASWFKPATDLRTPSEFANENWSFCQKQYVQNAISQAAKVPKQLAEAGKSTVGMVQDITSVVSDVFYNIWKFCYQTYSSFMTQMKTVAKLFQNFMINIYSIVEKINASVLSIVFGLIALVVSAVNAIQITLIVVIIVIGVLLIMQILLFYILMPISGLIITISALVAAVTVVITTAIAAAMVAELFDPGACFAKGTPVLMADGTSKPIEEIQLGAILAGGGAVTACHSFWTSDPLYDLSGIHVTGDHLVFTGDGNRRVPVRDHPAATRVRTSWWQTFQGGTALWCLTTMNRVIPCVSATGVMIQFADWEEIAEEDTETLTKWHRAVSRFLNPDVATETNPEPRVLDAEAGLSPDCLVACETWGGAVDYKPIRDIGIGDRVFDSPTTTTMVVGTVRIAGDQSTDAVVLSETKADGPQIVSCATWVRDNHWQPASRSISARAVDFHAIEWRHLYTKSGSFMIKGHSRIRDASDVGLEHLRPLVDSIVLTDSGSTK